VLQWETHGVEFTGNRRICLARLDYVQKWIVSDVDMTTRTFRDFMRRLAQYANAQRVEVKYMCGEAQRTDMVLLCLRNYRGAQNGYNFRRLLEAYGVSITNVRG